MNKKILMLILFGVIFLLGFNNVHAEKVVSTYGEIERDNWNLYDKDINRFTSPEEFLAEVDFYVVEISKFLNVKFDKHILFTFSKTSTSLAYTDKCSIVINQIDFLIDMAPLAHEITHILALGSDGALTEGLAEFMQERYGKNPDSDTIGYPIYSVAKAMLKYVDPTILDGVVFGGLNYKLLNQEDSFYFYIFSHSFVKYLIEKYGISVFMEAYSQGGYNYEKVFGEDCENLKKDWLAFIQEQPDLDEAAWVKKLMDLQNKAIKIKNNL